MRVSLVVPSLQKHIHGETFEPLGILYIAAGICDDYEVQIVDAFNRKMDLEDALREVVSFEPDVVGISITMSPTAPFGKALASGVKAACGSTVIVGGTHATFTAEGLAANPNIDVVALHEGEETFKEVLECLEKGVSFSDVRGLVYNDGEKTIRTLVREPLWDLDRLPFPARHLIPDHRVYNRKHILSSRGCVYRCIYCASSAMNHHIWRARSPENVVKEVEEMASKYSKTFYFADDNFPVDRDRTATICRGIVERGLDVNWACLSRVEFIDDPKLLETMAESGCREIFIGVESGSDEVLRKMHRNYTAEDVKRVVEQCNRTGIFTTVSFILGIPFEGPEDVSKTFKLATEVDTPNVAFHIFTPYVGTPAYVSPDKYGLKILSNDPELYDKNLGPVIETEYFTADEIMDLYCESFGISLRKGRQRWWR